VSMATGKSSSRMSKIFGSIKTAFKEIWRQTPGKAALILLLVLVSMAVVAVATITPEFLVKWESATYWEDNPVVVPPCWVNGLGFKTSKTAQVYFTQPSSTDINGSVVKYIYTYTYTLDVNEFTKRPICKRRNTTANVKTENLRFQQ